MRELATIGIDVATDVIAVCVIDQHAGVAEQRSFQREPSY